MTRLGKLFLAAALIGLALPAAASASEAPCALTPRAQCFGLESAGISFSTLQAGAHPDVTFSFALAEDPNSPPGPQGEHEAYSSAREVRFELPPGLIGDPNALSGPQQCPVAELLTFDDPGGGCPNGSQVGVTDITVRSEGGISGSFREPIYMMQPPGGDVVARLGFIAGTLPIFAETRVRSEGDYGLESELTEIPVAARPLRATTTIWGVPADPSHDDERCTPAEALHAGCLGAPSRPPGSRPLAFWTNPTRCGVSSSFRVAASSWAEPERSDEEVASVGPFTGCNSLPFGPSLEVEPTSHRAGAPTGLELAIRAPASDGVQVLEPSQTRYMKITMPAGLAINAGSGDGLATCSEAQVHFEERVGAQCPDAAKLADTEFDIPVLERNVKGGIYLRQPEPGNPFRIWIVADDLGLHVKLPGQLHVDEQTGQIESIVVGTSATEGIPQAPLREVRLLFKSGFRAPLVNPPSCGAFQATYEFTPWSGGPAKTGSAPLAIDEGCETGGFSPTLSAGSTEASAAAHSPFTFTLHREDSEQNVSGLEVALPKGISASFAGIARCEGQDAITGHCPAGSRIGRVTVAVGAGPAPLWVPQPGKRATGVFLSGPYEGAPLSIVAVVPKQAGPFDFGDEVVRSAVYVDPVTAQAKAVADPLPQLIEGIPILYRTINVVLDRPGFTLNPTSCSRKETVALLTSAEGRRATASSPYAAGDCAALGFEPRLSLKLEGGAKRGGHPALTATFRPRQGDANARGIVVRLPHSAFLDQAHIRTICTRVQFAAGKGNGAGCPAGSVYGDVTAHTPLFDFPLQGEAILRSSNHNLPDLVLALHGPPSLPIEIEAAGRIDSVRGGIRSSFEGIPDAPLSKVVLQMQGGKKGLIINSTDVCQGSHRAQVDLKGHNGKRAVLRPQLRARCPKQREGKRGHRGR